jgi:hypothetical protein
MVLMYLTLTGIFQHPSGKPWDLMGVARQCFNCVNVPVVVADVADVTDAVKDADGHAGTVSIVLPLLILKIRSRKMILTPLVPCLTVEGEMDVALAVALMD